MRHTFKAASKAVHQVGVLLDLGRMAADLITRSFRQTGIANTLDGSACNQLWENDAKMASDLDEGSSDSDRVKHPETKTKCNKNAVCLQRV